MIISLVSAAGSPGVSTTAVGLSLAWDRPVLLIEGDPTGSSAMLTGYLRQYAADGIISVFDLAVRLRQTGSIPNLMEAALAVPETTVGLLSGLRSHTQARAMSQAWPRILTELQGLDAAGVDVILDIGRLGLEGFPTLLLENSDLVVLVTRSTLPAIVAVNSWLPGLRQHLDDRGVAVVLLTIGAGRPYTKQEIEAQLKVPVAVDLPQDPVTAEVFHLGTTPTARFKRSPLYRALPPAVTALRTHLAAPQHLGGAS